MASASQEGHDAAPSLPSAQMLRVTLLSSEWRSTKGGVSTINRELAIQLAKLPNVEVSVYLPECSEDDKRVAASHRVKLIEAEKLHGLEPDLWLSSLPHHHAVDCVIGHGVDLGKQLQLIQRQHHCKWVQVVHSDPEELGMFKSHAGAISKAQKQHQLEVKLCELSDQVVAVGPKLGDAFSAYLRPFRKDANVFILTPGIFSEFAGVKQASKDRKAFSVLVLGHGDSEDLQLKGYDIAAKAIAELKDESRPYKLKVVGVPSGQEEEVAEMFLQQGIHRSQLVVRSFKEREQLAAQFCEVDLAVMPSRSEGFGLAALEALSAGLPVLVSGNSGLGEALKGVLHGSAYVLNSEDPKEWGRAIRNIREKRRDLRLMEAKSICEEYAKKYSWEEQCRSLAKRMRDLAAGELLLWFVFTHV